MRPLRRLLQLDDAMKLALNRTKPITRTEEIPILDASGRVSAERIVSSVSVPPFARSAMDGYAVRARDTYGSSRQRPTRLKWIETIYAGGVPKRPIRKGECSEIATGAMLPKGADAVVMVEDTEKKGGAILVGDSVHPGKNVSKKGEDITPGTPLVSKGELLNPSKIGALAAIGRDRVKVYSKPLVAVIPTGNEVAALRSKLRPGQVYNINTYTLATVAREQGAEVRTVPIVDDMLADLERVLRQNEDCDILVFSGGSSVGDRDIMLDVLEKNGEVIFHGIAVKPGKPTLFGVIEDQLVFGMPGYPTACLSNAYILLTPILRRMARLPEATRATVNAKMAKRVVSTTGRTQFLTVRLENGVAYPAFKESGAITSMAFADGYVVIPADVDLLEKDEEVTVHIL